MAKMTEEGILGAEQLGPEQYRLLKRRCDAGVTTPAERFAMRRYEIEAFYCEEVTQDLLKLHNDGKFRKSVRMYELLYLSKEDLRTKDIRDEDKLADDRDSLAQQQELFVALFSAAGLMGADRQFNVSKELGMGDLAGFTDECYRRSRTIERLLDIPVRKDVRENPTQQLNALLRIVGLSLGKPKTNSTGGDKRYIYTLDGGKLAQVQAIANRRADQSIRDAWKQKLQDREADQELEANLTKLRDAQAAIDAVKKVTKAPTAKVQQMVSMLGMDTITSG